MSKTQSVVIPTLIGALVFQRTRTLMTLADVENQPDPLAVLGWRPAPGRAHLAWQFMHIGITEELYGTERLLGRPAGYPEYVPRYRGGSVPDDEIPSAALIREVLEESRRHLLSALSGFTDDDLQVIPETFRERGWNLHTILHVLAWHEAHHQGQAHAVLNLWKASQAAS